MLKDNILITGIGVAGDFGIGKENFKQFVLNKEIAKKKEIEFSDYINTNFLRRADVNSHFACLSAKLALEDACINTEKIDEQKIGLVIATTQGAISYAEEYYKEIIKDGPAMASPLLFSNSVINIMETYVSIMFGIKGYSTTLCGYNSVLQSLQCAYFLISNNIVDICLVGGVDTAHDLMHQTYSDCILSKKQLGKWGGCGMLVLESSNTAKKRKSDIYAEILGVEILTADVEKVSKYNVSYIDSLLTRLDFNQDDIKNILTSCFNSRESICRQKIFLKNLKEKSNILDCSDLFGETFSATEAFKTILGILLLSKQIMLNKSFEHNILINSVTKEGSNGCMLLKEFI